MAKEKKSFFERLTGTVKMDEDNEELSGHSGNSIGSAGVHGAHGANGNGKFKKVNLGHMKPQEATDAWMEEESADAELTVDVYQTPDTIVIKAMTAGVDPNDLDVSIARDMVIIHGHREEEKTARTEDYFIQELYWGSFSRTITLPEEIDVDEAEAVGKHGLLILKLPKLDKKRQTKLKVKTI